MFVGRERERARIDRLLQDARAGRSAALLMHGEAGIGKTALMRWAIGRATGLRVLRARGERLTPAQLVERFSVGDLREAA